MSDIEKRKRVYPGYQPLANVLQAALDQAQAGKGNQRHANGKPFLEQPIITDGRACGLAGPAFQARKKILGALNCPYEERAVQDLLGAIVYTAAMVILKEEERQKWNETNQCAEPWQPAISEQVATGSSAIDRVLASASRVEVHNGPNVDSRVPMPEVYGGYVACSGCGLKCSIGSEQEQSVNLTGRCTLCRAEKEREAYTIPPLQDGDDDPVVHIVPDKTSRATSEQEAQARAQVATSEAQARAQVATSEAQVREQVATSAQAKDTARDAMATSAQRREAIDALTSACREALRSRDDDERRPINNEGQL